MTEEISDLKQSKINNLKKIIELGINPYAHNFDKKNYAKKLHEQFDSIKNEEEITKDFSVAGRIMSLRKFGKLSFGDLTDETGKIQFAVREKQIDKKTIELFNLIDRGDLIGIKGSLFKTKKGELTINVKKIELLTKSIEVLPEKFHGLKDKETRYRQRYLDLIINPEVKEIFEKRRKTIKAIREFLETKGYKEVETPILQPIYGGTNAQPFDSKLNELNMKVYMRISNEMYLKRLITGGYEKIFEFSQDFRNEGIDKTHNPEFLQMETMAAYKNYEYNIELCEEMVEFVAKKVLGTTKFSYQGKEIDVKRPWKKITLIEAVKKETGIDFEKEPIEKIKEKAEKQKIENAKNKTWAQLLTDLFEEKVEHTLIKPTIVYDFPSELSPLAKKKENNKKFVERFEPYINGWEIGNSYSELNNPEELKKNWENQEKALKKGDSEAQRMDYDFIKAMEIGMPPTSGIGIGIDRLVMLLTDSISIRDVILFPFMKLKE